MPRRTMFLVLLAGLAVPAITPAAAGESAAGGAASLVRLSKELLHAGRISPMLYGGFIELLDDLVPGMWAEMLNDRGFEGIVPCSNWCYHTGDLNTCDRPWDVNETWRVESAGAFNGAQCACLTASPDRPASLSQSGLAVTKGMTYHFAGFLRADPSPREVHAVLKTALPDGTWMVLARQSLAVPTNEWTKRTCELVSTGTTDRARFELRVVGSGRVWADKLSLLPGDHLKGWRNDVVEAVRDLQPAVLRWGGSIVDPGEYRWKQGIGDRDRRVPFPNKVWGRIDPNDVGLDEFLQFCELVSAEPLVCVSFSDGPDSARDLVEYCNGSAETAWGGKRAANGHPEPYRVKYFQLGNELGGAAHAKGCIAFCEAIRKADPNVVILASYPSPELLEAVGPHIAMWCPHYYTEDLAAIDADIRKLEELARRMVPAHPIRIGVTEWNVTGGMWGLMRGKLHTLDFALQNARCLHVFHRHADQVALACRSNLVNSFCSGAIQTNPAGLFLTPSYYVMQLYAKHSKPVPLRVAGGPDGIDVSLCGTEDGRSACLFAVNARGEPLTIEFDPAGWAATARCAGGEVVCDTLDMRQTDVMNHWSAPRRVRTVPLTADGHRVTLPALSAAAIEWVREP